MSDTRHSKRVRRAGMNIKRERQNRQAIRQQLHNGELDLVLSTMPTRALRTFTRA